MSQDDQKLTVAREAAGLILNDMVVGLGSGTTAEIVVRLLGDLRGSGLRFRGVPTSGQTADLALSVGIPLVNLDECGPLDIAIDGADEVDPDLNCIKGHGGQLLREKIVATAAKRFVVIVDSTKRVARLGERAPIPVEVIPFGWTTTRQRLERLGLRCELRGAGSPFVTAGGNYILDCRLPAAMDLANSALAQSIKSQVGVVEHGLFLEWPSARTVVVARPEGGVDVLERPVGQAPSSRSLSPGTGQSTPAS
ncbi:MAG: ribose-5-phosphate isomerase RpiA [Chloroflexota bacterium]|nr:MAG: ribose 5-phosphate isomerase A [Chloroflexota bacterium]